MLANRSPSTDFYVGGCVFVHTSNFLLVFIVFLNRMFLFNAESLSFFNKIIALVFLV